MEFSAKKKSSGSSSMLAPGFRFHPTDEELVRYYLRRKVCGKSFRFDAISEIDIYKTEPWDLPTMSKLRTRDLEWYFFSMLDKKYGNGAKTNRATEKGYWKTTGKDRAVYHRNEIVGMKKTLVYHIGRAPKGQRTNWVMHEYKLVDLELERVGIVQDAFVLCRVFQKSGPGPKNGEKYGAPYVEEDWEDEELDFSPREEAAEEVDFGADAYLDGHDLEQILGSDVPSITVPPSNLQSTDSSCGEEPTQSASDTQNLLVGAGEQSNEPEQGDHKNSFDLPAQYDMDLEAVKHEFIGESSNSENFEDLNFLLDEPFLDAPNNLQYGDVGFIESDDLSNPIKTDTSALDMLDEYLTFFDANGDDSQYLEYDPAVILGSEELLRDQPLLPQKDEGTLQAALPSGHVIDNIDNGEAWLSDKQELTKDQSDYDYPFMSKASQKLATYPTKPAFAAEFPPKNAILRLNSLAQSSSSVNFTAGMFHIRSMNVRGNGTHDRSSCKHENFNILLSFGFARGDDGSASLESSVSIRPGKTLSTISRGWFYYSIFMWVMFLYMSFKIGSYICAH
ncbi:hypothetical protein ACJIZ3_022858 [Penstemon smallii]|uniref:NAC domain-containing protein n=1 Tax=Penstemon smallii TaxID=265156 RepID=A0ABD3TPI0_9LAMI